MSKISANKIRFDMEINVQFNNFELVWLASHNKKNWIKSDQYIINKSNKNKSDQINSPPIYNLQNVFKERQHKMEINA